jgi:hypothetical protein
MYSLIFLEKHNIYVYIYTPTTKWVLPVLPLSICSTFNSVLGACQPRHARARQGLQLGSAGIGLWVSENGRDIKRYVVFIVFP